MNHPCLLTLHKPTTVNFALKVKLTEDLVHLVLSRATQLEVYALHSDGLHLLASCTMNGQITSLNKIPVANSTIDLLFITTDNQSSFVLGWNNRKRTFETLWNADLPSSFGRVTGTGVICCADELSRAIVLHAHQGWMSILYPPTVPALKPKEGEDWLNPWDPNRVKFTTVRIPELNVVSIAFRKNVPTPSLAVLSRDSRGDMHLKVKDISSTNVKLHESTFQVNRIDHTAEHVVPLADGGLLIVGRKSLSYVNGRNPPINRPFINVGIVATELLISGDRVLLGDRIGVLYVVLLEINLASPEQYVANMDVHRLGITSIPTAICYLDNAVTYIGSHYGDSQLIKLTTEPDPVSGVFFQIMDTFYNIAPISDMAVVNIEAQSQSQIVTCSGAYKDGSLRIIRSGVGITEFAYVDLLGCQNIWVLSSKSRDASKSDMLVCTWMTETRLFQMTGNELEEEQPDGLFDLDSPSICCAMFQQHWVQITDRAINIICPIKKERLSHWKVEGDSVSITNATANDMYIVISLSDCSILLFKLQNQQLSIVSRCKLHDEIACLYISDVLPHMCVIGYWNQRSVDFFAVPDLKKTGSMPVPEKSMPRSLLLSKFNDKTYLLVATGDGRLVYSDLNDAHQPVETKSTSIASRPCKLIPFKMAGTQLVLVASDKPVLIYENRSLLNFSSVGISNLISMAVFGPQSSLALLTDQGIVFGLLQDIQKLHVQKVELHEQPHRLLHHPETRTFAVATSKVNIDPMSFDEKEDGFIKLLDDQTFEILDSVPLHPNEVPLSMCVVNEEYFVVGTEIMNMEKEDPQKGRIILFSVQRSIDMGSSQDRNRRLELICFSEVKGAVYSIVTVCDSIVCSINHEVVAFSIAKNGPTQASINSVASFTGNIVALYLDSIDNQILVGDLIKSISLLEYDDAAKAINEVARDFYSPAWITAVRMIDRDNFLAAENNNNILIWRRQNEESGLKATVGIHLGDQINCFSEGSINFSLETSARPILFGTANGMLGMLTSISDEAFHILSDLQQIFSATIPSLGNLSHDRWREVSGSDNNVFSQILDGDIVQQYLDLSDEMRAELSDANPRMEPPKILKSLAEIEGL